MRLFVAGQEANSRVVMKNIVETPALLVDQPVKTRLLGNLENRDRVLAVLGVAV
jgi:hypothetical protein